MARAWGARLRWHVAAYLVLLVALLGVLGTTSSINNDEGAYILQAKSLSSGQGWQVQHPLPLLDPSGEAFYVRLSSGGPTTFVYYGRHPLYPTMLAVGDRLGGVTAMVMLSILGAVAAAAGAACIAGTLRPGATRWAFWGTAVGSPLLFTSQQVIAHTLGAACAAWAVWLILRMPATRGRWVHVAGAVALLIIGTMLRSEMALFAVALAVGSVVGGAGDGRRRWVRGALLAAAVPMAVGLDSVWVRLANLDLSAGVSATDTGTSIVQGRIQAIGVTLVRGPSDSTVAWAALLVAAAVVAWSALVVRQQRMTKTIAVAVAFAAASLIVVAALSSTSLIPGLLLVCPVLVAGGSLLGAEAGSSPARAVAVWTAVGFMALLLLVQYAQGGIIEWGARFAVVALPLLVAVAVVSILDAGTRLDAVVARRLGVGLVVASVLLAGMSIRSAVAYHRTITTWTHMVADVEARTPGPDFGDGDTRPIVVASVAAFGRWMWPIFDSHRGLEITDIDTCEYLDRSRAAGVEALVLVSLQSHQGGVVCGYRVVRSTSGGDKGRIYVEELVEA